MLEKFIASLQKDLELEKPLSADIDGSYAIPLEEGLTVTLSTLPEGFMLQATVGECPTEKEELFFTETLLANLFGQGTRGAVLGLNENGNQLTLSRNIEYNIDYKEFKEIVEDFINSVDFWREEIEVHRSQAAN